MAENPEAEIRIQILVSGPNPPFDFALQGDYWTLCALIGGLALCLKHPQMNNKAGEVLKMTMDSLIDHFSSLTPPAGFVVPKELKKEWAVWKACKTLPLPMEDVT